MHSTITSLGRPALLAVTLGLCALPAGCVGIYNNTDKFFHEPDKDMAEAELVRKYGMPDYSDTLADGVKIYGYKVRDVKYIILVGIYEGYDLVVEVRDGKVADATRVPRPRTLTICQPLPWAVAD